MDEVRQWQTRPLEAIYPIVYVDCLLVNVRENQRVLKKALYLVLAVNLYQIAFSDRIEGGVRSKEQRKSSGGVSTPPPLFMFSHFAVRWRCASETSMKVYLRRKGSGRGEFLRLPLSGGL